jgi:YD repeat-containing protein
MKKAHLTSLLIVLTLGSCSNNSNVPDESSDFDWPKEGSDKSALYINLEDYDINDIEVEYLPNHTFLNPTFSHDLRFQSSVDYNNFYGNDAYNGNVKKVKEYTKRSEFEAKELSSTEHYNPEGYLIKSKYAFNDIFYFEYDSQNNLTKETHLLDNDTAYFWQFEYNEKKQLIAADKRDRDSNYSFVVTIEYDDQSRPNLLRYTYALNQKSYVKKVSYDGNIVTITKMEGDRKVNERVLTYSKNNHLIRQDYKNHTWFYDNNESGQVIKERSYSDYKYKWTNAYVYNKNGDKTSWIFTNHLKDHEEINTYEIEYDSLKNIIYKHTSNNVLDRTSEYFFEIEYY